MQLTYFLKILSFNRAQTFHRRLWIWQQGNSWRLRLLEKVSFLSIILFPLWIDHYHSHSFVLHLLPPVVTQEQLDRAKEATKSAVLMNLESRVQCSWSWSNPNCMTCFPKVSFTLHTFALMQSIASEDIGRQVLTYGERYESIAM